MKKVNIYSNGKSLFTLENYDKTSGVCHSHNITLHSVIDKLMARAMHDKGQLHYIVGLGDRKVLKGIELKRSLKLEQFDIC